MQIKRKSTAVWNGTGKDGNRNLTEKFKELVKEAEANCPVSKLVNTKITVNLTLN